MLCLLVHFHLVILSILVEEYALQSSLLCRFHKPPVALSLYVETVSSAPCSQTPSFYEYIHPLMSETKFRAHTEPQAKL
jgi:hypothetical protein